jgi:two-component system response regulator HydG
MDPALQVKILRVLQERTCTRVGGTEKIELDIHIIAATNKDLKAEVNKGTFREDLFYRLNVVPIVIPPLRVRTEDIPLLAQHFLEKFTEENSKKFKSFTPEAMEILMNYEWPGNVRELENNVERIVVLNEDTKVKPQHLPRFIVNTEKKLMKAIFPGGDTYHKILSLDQVERYAIEAAINRCRGDVIVAAKKLGIGQATLYRKIKRYKIHV